MEQIGERVGKQRQKYVEKPIAPINPIPATPGNSNQGTDKTIARKICPFRSFRGDEPCVSRCKLFRNNASGHNCPFQEIRAISWKLSNPVENKKRK